MGYLPTRSATKKIINPGRVGGEKMNVKDLALTTIFAALYAALVLAFAGISFQLVQVRVADALIPLSIVFGLARSNWGDCWLRDK